MYTVHTARWPLDRIYYYNIILCTIKLIETKKMYMGILGIV